MAGLIERTPAGQVFAAQFVPDPHAHRRRVWSRASLAKSFDGLGGGRDARGTHFVRIAPWRGPRHHHGVHGQAPALFPAELKALRFQASSCGHWAATSDTAAGSGDAIRKTMRRFFVNPSFGSCILMWRKQRSAGFQPAALFQSTRALILANTVLHRALLRVKKTALRQIKTLLVSGGGRKFPAQVSRPPPLSVLEATENP